MNFVYEDISKEDFEQFGITELKAKYQSPNFDMWAVNHEKNTFMLYNRSSIMPEDEDFGVSYFLFNINGLWVDFEVETIAVGGQYRGETWVKYGIKKVTPFIWDDTGRKHNLSIDALPVAYETVVSTFCDALAARSHWGHDESVKHDVFFENLTASKVQS
jgi:hypothetical protein